MATPKSAGGPEQRIALFWTYVRPNLLNGCWEWQGPRTRFGHGSFYWRGRHNVGAHRVAYEIENGPIPTTLFVRHRCDNPPCVNPSHLELGTHQDNMRDRNERGRTSRHRPASAKLSLTQVEQIKAEYPLIPKRAGRLKYREAFGVSQRTINGIMHGEVYRGGY